MQQRQLRLGDILDDYCPRERRVTNHAVVAMVGDDVKQTRCTTCDTEHEYKHAKVPRQRKKSDTPAALYAQVATNAPKRVAHETAENGVQDSPFEPNGALDATSDGEPNGDNPHVEAGQPTQPEQASLPVSASPGDSDGETERDDTGEDRADEEGPVHRPLIRASLPRPEGQQPPQRPFPEFTIRQPGGRPSRFRPRHPRGGGQQGHQGHQGHHFQGNRSNGNMGGPMRGPRPNAGRPGMMKRHGPPGRKRSK